MNKGDYNNSVLDFKLGFERGGRTVNKSFSSFVSEALRNGDGYPMANYNNNKRVLDDIKSEIEEEFSENLKEAITKI